MHRITIGATGVALVLAAGCGGAKPAASVSPAALAAQADAICRSGGHDARQSKVANQNDGPGQFYSGVARRQRAIVAELDKISPPEALAASYDAYKQTLLARGALYARAADEAEAHPQEKVSLPTTSVVLQRKVNKLRTELHLRVCA